MKNISPHVEIYRFPITALSSITNRITGLYLTGVFIGTGTIGFINPDLLSNYNKLENKYKIFLEYSVYFCSAYHIFGGIRHFIWDRYPYLLTNKAVTQSSYVLYGTSIVSCIIIDKLYSKFFVDFVESPK